MKPKTYISECDGRYKAEYSLPGSTTRICVGTYSTRHIAHQHATYAAQRASKALPVIDAWLVRPAVVARRA